ncbi:MAG: Gfo/Idh/MocA family oxidoreductase [Phycisphaeraceae bacterium]
MINVGVIGLGMMGLTHLDAYAKRDDVNVVAIADKDPNRLSGKVKAVGNVEGQAQGGFDFDKPKKYEEGMDLIRSKRVDAVDICLPTHMHLEYAKSAIRKGKHVLIEKPLARTAKDAAKLVALAEKSAGVSMCAMCMRFWPGWSWLKDAVDDKRYGKVMSAQFRRVASHPGGAFYASGELSGGAILDLHIHDTDFVQFLFGPPKAVSSRGYSKVTTAVDHVVTHYIYDDIPIVVAEGSWAMAEKFPFSMAYTINFEQATAVYTMGSDHPLTLYRPGNAPEKVELEKAMGYDLEIDNFLNCIKNGTKPTTVTLADAANTIRIIEAEEKSVRTGKPVNVKI